MTARTFDYRHAKRLRDRGWRYSDIAAHFGVHTATAARAVRLADAPAKPPRRWTTDAGAAARQRILIYIQAVLHDTGSTPTIRDIGAHVGLVPSNVHHHLSRLEDDGWLARPGFGTHGTLRLCRPVVAVFPDVPPTQDARSAAWAAFTAARPEYADAGLL